jgi:hypothetical protein
MEDASGTSRLKLGDVVEVRRASEILKTLDRSSALDAVPLIPEMVRYVCSSLRPVTYTTASRSRPETPGRPGHVFVTRELATPDAKMGRWRRRSLRYRLGIPRAFEHGAETADGASL